MIKRHKYSLSNKQIQLLSELLDADRTNNGICYQDSTGEYVGTIKEDIDFLKSFGFITEYTSEMNIKESGTTYKKGWTITYHGIAFLFAYNTMAGINQK